MNNNITFLGVQTCYTGTATQNSKTQSVVRGIIDTMQEYRLPEIGETTFVTTMSDELYCIRAMAVRTLFHLSWRQLMLIFLIASVLFDSPC